MTHLLYVLIVGTSDVDGRLDLMQSIRDDFHLSAAGTAAHLRAVFQQAGFVYDIYPLARRVSPLTDLRTVVSLARLFRRRRPDLVHAFDTKPCVFARIAAWLARVPVIAGTLPGLGALYADEQVSTRMVRALYEQLQRLASHRSDLTIFQNHHDARQFIARGIVPESRFTVIPGSGVRTDLFDPATIPQSERARVRAELGIAHDALAVTMIARVIRAKGVLEFAAAAQAVRARRPGVAFLLVGPADDDSVDRLTPAEQAQLAQTVTWAGARKDIPAVLAASDVFALPSFYREGIPRALLEAASMGLPLITTDSPGCNEAVGHEVNGFLIPPHDPAALAQAILRLADDPDMRRRFGQASRQRAVACFDLAKIADETRSVYKELLARKGLLPGGDA